MAPSRPSRGPTPLPPYEPPTHPLTPAAQRTLQALPQTHPLIRLKRHLEVATNSLTELAGEVNDRYWQRAEYERRRKARRAGQGHEDDEGGAEEERERELERMRVEVEGLTGRMEESVRRVIDAKARVEGTESALVEVAANVVAGNGTAAAVGGTQSTLGASQFRQGRKGRGGGKGRAGDEEEEGSEFEEEPATQDENGQEGVGPAELLRKKMEEHKVRYDGLPLRTRYATNNSYIGFKRIVHDALHPGDDAPPLPNPSTWFPSDPTLHPSTNTRTRARGNDADADEDDDLAIASERISIKCPLTLLPYKDPVTSSKCPHSFEKAAILDMISRSAGRVGGEKAVKCPVCEMMLTPSTLHPDPILLRKVARIQAAEARAADETAYSSDHDGDGRTTRDDSRRAEEIVDDGENDGKAATRARSLAPRVKAERMASLAPAAVHGGGGGSGTGSGGGGGGELVGTQTVTEGGAVVVDLGEGDEEEGDMDGDEVEEED